MKTRQLGNRSKFLLVLQTTVLVCAVGLVQGASQGDGPASSFYGAVHPSIYLSNMANSRGYWSPADKTLFVERAIEAYLWVKKYNSDVAIDPNRELPGILKMFPELAGRPDEFYTVYGVGLNLAKTHPQIAKAVKLHEDPKAGFHGYSSPAEMIGEEYWVGSRPFSAKEWVRVWQLLEAGARWENRHPNIDFGLDPGERFIKRIRMRFPKLRVKVSATGVHVRDLYGAVLLASSAVTRPHVPRGQPDRIANFPRSTGRAQRSGLTLLTLRA